MATIVDTSSSELMKELASRAQLGVPFNPLDEVDMSAANVDRLKKSMQSFGWDDPRFITKEQAAMNGWTVNSGVNRILVSTRNNVTGNFDSVSLHNAQDVNGIPPLEAMLAMSDAQVLKLRGAGGLVSHGHVGEDALANEVPLDTQPPLSVADVPDLGDDDELSVGPARGIGLSPGEQAEYLAMLERFTNNQRISEDVKFREIEDNNYGLIGVPNDELDVETAAVVVSQDIAALNGITNRNERYFAVLLMGVNANNQANYRTELGLQAPHISVEAAAASQSFLTSIDAREQAQRDAEAQSAGERDLGTTSPGIQPETAVIDANMGRFAVMAPYWVNGLHNAEGIALAVEINKLIKAKKLAEDKEAIARLLSIQPKAREFGVEVVPLSLLLDDPDLKTNKAQPRFLLGGALVRDLEGAYRSTGLGSKALLVDKGGAIVLKSKGVDAYRGAMELALAKGWTAIELKGKPAVLADAWLEAKLMNLDVVNYQPTEKDQVKFAQRVAADCARNKGPVQSREQAPEMVEVRPFVDANGETKMATVTYTVTFQGGQDATFTSAMGAARAFGGLSAASCPVVIRSVTRADGEVRDSVVAGFDIRRVKGAGARTLERMEDREFEEALGEVIDGVNEEAKLEQEAVTQGNHVGPVVAINGVRFAQKIGRDPAKVVWHDLANLSGPVPKVGDMAEIGYSKGVGIIKQKTQEKELG